MRQTNFLLPMSFIKWMYINSHSIISIYKTLQLSIELDANKILIYTTNEWRTTKRSNRSFAMQRPWRGSSSHIGMFVLRVWVFARFISWRGHFLSAQRAEQVWVQIIQALEPIKMTKLESWTKLLRPFQPILQSYWTLTKQTLSPPPSVQCCEQCRNNFW
jgi:hypothetical protein